LPHESPERVAIVVADDFGLSPGVNRGVVEAHECGPTTTGSLLVNMPGFDDAVARVQQCPTLAVGLHLNLTLGRPVSNPEHVASLVGSEGNFLCFGAWMRRWVARGIDPDDVLRECRAQAQRIADAGLPMGHCDVHQLLDALPVARRAVVRTCREFGIPAVRPLRDRPTLADLRALNLPGPRVVAWPRRIVKFAAMRLIAAGSTADYANAGLLMPDRCVGLFIGGGQDLDGYKRIFSTLSPGVSEVCVHPGYVDDGLRATPFKFVEAREEELRALTDPGLRQCIEEHSVRLATYDVLAQNG